MMSLLREKHVHFIATLDDKRDGIDYYLSEHLRLNGVYWGLACLHLLHRPDALDRDGLIAFVRRCYNDKDGGFGGHEEHDAHLLYTLSALQILKMLDALDDTFDTETIEHIVQRIVALQQPDGSFFGDEWGEVDTRFSYCAIAALSLLNALDRIDTSKAASFIDATRNMDGGYGAVPGAESHAGQSLFHLLVLAGRLPASLVGPSGSPVKQPDTLARFLADRQLPSGGLNGRPEKLEDVCYSWWILSSLCLLNRRDWISADALSNFIYTCQDEELGGIADRPGNVADVFHTFFGVAGLALLDRDDLATLDPAMALPTSKLAPRT